MRKKILLLFSCALFLRPLSAPAHNVGFQNRDAILREATVLLIARVQEKKTEQFPCRTTTYYSFVPEKKVRGRISLREYPKFEWSTSVYHPYKDRGCPMVTVVLPPLATHLENGAQVVVSLKEDKEKKMLQVTGTYDLDVLEKFQRGRR